MMVGARRRQTLADRDVGARALDDPAAADGRPGVANVPIWGQRDRQLQVQVDPAQLRAAGVTPRQVIETAGNALWVSPLTFLEASTPGTGGFIDTPNQRLGIQHILPIRDARATSRKVAIEGSRRQPLRSVTSRRSSRTTSR